jgi:hypothetical protein
MATISDDCVEDMVVGRKGMLCGERIIGLGCVLKSWHVISCQCASELREKINILLTACPSMRKWLWSLSIICFLFLLINSMPKCFGCKKEFQSQGFPAHKKFCNPYKRGIKARLTNVLDSNPVAGPSNKTTILDDVDNLGIAEDMVVDDVPAVCNGEINDQKKY